MAEEVIEYRFRMRRGLAATWTSLNGVLLEGEYGFEKDTGKVKIGDGSTPWNDLAYFAGDLSPIFELILGPGDLLVGSAPGVLQRLPKGTAGQVLTVGLDGNLSYQTPASASGGASGEILVASGAVSPPVMLTGSDELDYVYGSSRA